MTTDISKDLHADIAALDRRITTLEKAMRRAADIIDKNLYRQAEKVEDARSILLRALEDVIK